MPRAIKQTRVEYKNAVDTSHARGQQSNQRSRSRSRDKHTSKATQPKQQAFVKIDTDRRAKMLAMRKKINEEPTYKDNTKLQHDIKVVLKTDERLNQTFPKQETQNIQVGLVGETANQVTHIKEIQKGPESQNKDSSDSQNSLQACPQKDILFKPVFINTQNRSQLQSLQSNQHKIQPDQHIKQQQRRKKAIRHTTKLLLNQTMANRKPDQNSDDQLSDLQGKSSDEQMTTLPSDNDNINQEYQYELWKIRELKRIRRDQQQRQRAIMEKAELQRRRKMNNEEIMLENRMLGSDLTDNNTETKYVFMQKYYHKGAFYQDSQDAIFKRDYNLPTPLEMQDKSMLPQIMQKRKGQFGMKGQSKYTHLSQEDTTNFDPQFRPDQAIMDNWKKKTGGYKGNAKRNI